jgi:hypothetical protein
VGQKLGIQHINRVGNHPLPAGLPHKAKAAGIVNLSRT